MISWFGCVLVFFLLVITGAHRLLVIVRNSKLSIKKNSNMNPRLSGYIFILGLVFYVLVENLQFLTVHLDIERSY